MFEFISNIFSKSNRAQEQISNQEGHSISTTSQQYGISKAYSDFEVVQNGVAMVVGACCEFDIDIKDSKKLSEGIPSIRKGKLHSLLNHKPNEHQDIQTFRSQIFMDYILEGNIFLYWDGAFLYHLPASSVVIEPDPKTYVKKYVYNNVEQFLPEEIIHIQDPGMSSIYRGTSRLHSAARSIEILSKMRDFQSNFFKNGCVPGLVLETDNNLGQAAKQRTIEHWMKQYNPVNGAKRPIILDNGLKLKAVSDTKFTDLDFEESSSAYERKILKALGIPPILMDGGNNANIAPNLRLFYLETILPIVRRYSAALERFFGFDLDVVTSNVTALQPELKEIASFYSTLVNAGIITSDEARIELRYPPKGGDNDKIRIPANIAGSASNPSEGGKPAASDITEN